MDKIKPILELLKKNLFWILCVGALGVTAGVYHLVSSSISAEQATRESEIDNKFKLAEEIRTRGVQKDNQPVHPNQSMVEGLQALVASERDAVREKWAELYAQQQVLLTWPKALHPSATNHFKQYRPIERMIKFTPEPEKEARTQFRVGYQEVVREELIDLAAKIGEVWLPALKRKPTNEELNRKIIKATNDGSRVVIWDSKNQDYWESKFTNWIKPYNQHPTGIPRTIQVLYAQEDLWVLNSILEDIIKPTNGDAVANDLAKIKRIDHIYIGHDAQGIVGNVDVAAAVVSRDPSAGVSGLAPSTGDLSMGDGILDPANGRYVNREFEPLDAKTLRDSFTATNKDMAYLAIAKRIPVRIGMQMDERAVWDLLVHCANARFPLEVRQVRINSHTPHDRGSLASAFDAINTVGQSTSGGLGPAMGSEEMITAPATGIRSESQSVGAVSDFKGAYQIPVEIFGIIYLYNPPDKAIVSPGEETAAVTGQNSPTG